MADAMVERVQRNPKYQQLRSRRGRLGWILAILMWIVYYGYIGLIAFDKEFLARPLGSGVTTVGVPIGIGIIVFTVAIVIYYVQRANREFDALTQEILEEATQ